MLGGASLDTSGVGKMEEGLISCSGENLMFPLLFLRGSRVVSAVSNGKSGLNCVEA